MTFGIFSADYECHETSRIVTVFEIAAEDTEHAERLGKEVLSKSFTWRCTGVDRVRNQNAFGK